MDLGQTAPIVMLKNSRLKNPEKLPSNGMQRVKETVPFDKLPALQCDGPAQVRSKALLKYE